MDLTTFVLFVLGLGLLIVGADFLIRGASKLALAVGISPLVVGLTVVAYGTSAPELAISTLSAFKGQADIAFGNVVGSNIFNVLLILGISALITPLRISEQLVRLDVPLMIVISVLTFVLALDGSIGRIEGALLFAGAVAYTWFQIWQSRRESIIREQVFKEGASREKHSAAQVAFFLFMIALGLALLVIGANWFVAGAIALARTFGVSELVIGLTIVAAGTSMPEVATSVVAALRGERDIAVGNIVGSNIFNILCVLGASAVIAPQGVAVSSQALWFDVPVMIAVAVACWPIFYTGLTIARWEAMLFLIYYALYTLYLSLVATKGAFAPQLATFMQWIGLPITAAVLLIGAARADLKPASVEVDLRS